MNERYGYDTKNISWSKVYTVYSDDRDDELNLLASFIKGDLQATRIFFERYGGIIQYAVNLIDIEDTAIDREDLFQEVILYLLENDKKVLRAFKGKGKLSSYLFIVSRRYALRVSDKGRKRQIKGADNILLKEIPASLVEKNGSWSEEQEKALEQAIKRLSLEDQLFIRMLVYDKRPISEIMRIFPELKSPNSVYSKKSKIIEKLKKIIKILEKEGLC